MKTLRYNGVLHTPKLSGDVGYDLPVGCTPGRDKAAWYDRLVGWWIGHPCYVIWPRQMRSIPTGVRMDIPEGQWVQMLCRSSARDARLMLAGGGVIDGGYRGYLYAILYNFGWKPRVLRFGDRYVQAVFMLAVKPWATPMSDAGFEGLPPTSRGTAGFGSTGR